MNYATAAAHAWYTESSHARAVAEGMLSAAPAADRDGDVVVLSIEDLRRLKAVQAAGLATCADEEEYDMIDAPRTNSSAVVGLPEMLLKAYTEIRGVLDNLRTSRNVIEQATVEKLHHTSAKLLEVSSATEVAATGILDGLDRAIAVVDELDGMEGATQPNAVDARNRLRDELFAVQACVQFQDITNQQLAHASSLLVDMEERLVGLARTLDPNMMDEEPVVPATESHVELAFDPNATIGGAEVRQALADSIFTN